MFLKEILFLDKFKIFKSKHVNLDIFDLIQILEMQIKLFFFFYNGSLEGNKSSSTSGEIIWTRWKYKISILRIWVFSHRINSIIMLHIILFAKMILINHTYQPEKFAYFILIHSLPSHLNVLFPFSHWAIKDIKAKTKCITNLTK
jgi:hypothetical protein